MEIVICGRNVEVPEQFRDHTGEKLARLARYDHKIVRMSVELSHEPNPRRAKSCQCVQITGRGRGPVVRGEACAADFLSALDLAVTRLEERLRRAHDRRRVHHGRRQPISVAQATARTSTVALLERPGGEADTAVAATETDLLPDAPDTGLDPASETASETEPDLHAGPDTDGALDDPGSPGRIVRRKEHHAVPMSTDDALSQMELVGHDFFLFACAETGRPSVVYRRHGYDYGVITLATT